MTKIYCNMCDLMENKTIILINNRNKSYSKTLINESEIKYDKNLVSLLKSYDKSKIYNLTHIEDMDGMTSAALLKHYYDLPYENIIFADYGELNLKNTIADMKKSISNGVLVITDLSLNEKFIPIFKKFLRFARTKKNKVIWLDHHFCGEDTINSIFPLLDYAVIGENRKFCGAELVYNILCEKSEIGSTLAKIAHAMDFKVEIEEKYNKHIKNILYAISYLNKNGNYKKNLRDFIKDIENLDFNSELIRNAARKYTETAKIETKYIINNTSVFDSNGYKIAVGFGKDLNSTDVCDSIEKKVNSDLIIYAKSDSYSASLRRSKNIDINCIKIAAKMGGGGHPFAAGFPIPVNIDIATNTGRKIFVNKIKKVVDSVLKNDS